MASCGASAVGVLAAAGAVVAAGTLALGKLVQAESVKDPIANNKLAPFIKLPLIWSITSPVQLVLKASPEGS